MRFGPELRFRPELRLVPEPMNFFRRATLLPSFPRTRESSDFDGTRTKVAGLPHSRE
ncbi:hypothetical protein [Lysobacter gummosus]|uniref:hypothetical protein n=1 Tax=Lysobacter gummosus TaxID=262324 RepID=UPI003630BA1E